MSSGSRPIGSMRLGFERLVTEAGRAEGAPNGRAREALGLWRGVPLADVAHEPFASAEIRRLEDLRLQAVELAIDADLAARRHGDVLGELRSMIVDEPLRERLRAQYMLALYRSGRQAEALEPIGTHARRSSRRSASSPAPSCDASTRRFSGRIPSSNRPRRPDPARARCRDAAGGSRGRAGVAARALAAGARRRRWAVLIAGERGVGKTRLAAELAAEVLREGGAVLYVSASGSRAALSERLAAARSAGRATLLVLDDVGRATGGLEATSESPAWSRCRCSWWRRRSGRGGGAAAGCRDAELEAAGRRWRTRRGSSLHGRA